MFQFTVVFFQDSAKLCYKTKLQIFFQNNLAKGFLIVLEVMGLQKLLHLNHTGLYSEYNPQSNKIDTA